MDRLRRPGTLLLLAVFAIFAVVVLVVQFTGLTDRPPGYYIDESSFSWNAWTIDVAGVDEHGRPLPLFFEAFGDWKTAPYIYLLAAVFAVTGPSILAARVVSAVAGVLTVAFLGALGYRMTRRVEIALLTGAMALLLPWTFEPTRLAMEVALMPALVAGFLLALHARPPGSTRWSFVLLAGILALLTYTYTLGRLLGPLLALGLVVYATRDRWRPVLATWVVYGVLLIPFALFYLGSPDAALVRLNEAGYMDRPLPEIAGTFVAQLLGNLDPYRWLVSGDPNLRHHAPEIGGPMLVGVLAFGLMGLVVAIGRVRLDAFARYLLFGLAVAFIPASLTLDAFHQHRHLADDLRPGLAAGQGRLVERRPQGHLRGPCAGRPAPGRLVPNPLRHGLARPRRLVRLRISAPARHGARGRRRPDLSRGRDRPDLHPRLLVRRASRRAGLAVRTPAA